MDRPKEEINSRETYVFKPVTGNAPDKYHAGILYFGYKNYRVGWNNEQVRHVAQNRIAHDIVQGGRSPYFSVLDIERSRYYSVGTSNAYTLW